MIFHFSPLLICAYFPNAHRQLTINHMILVTGASGTVGRAVLDELRKTGEPFRAMVRAEGDLPGAAVADFSDKESLKPALAGVTSARKIIRNRFQAGTARWKTSYRLPACNIRFSAQTASCRTLSPTTRQAYERMEFSTPPQAAPGTAFWMCET